MNEMLSKLLCLCSLRLSKLPIRNQRNVFQISIKSKRRRQYSPELMRTCNSALEFNRITNYLTFERIMIDWFRSNGRTKETLAGDVGDEAEENYEEDESVRRYRCGLRKQYFTYMLMDPYITDNLADRSFKLDKFDVWKLFLNSIFYVGKGKAARPYKHFKDALKCYITLKQENGNPESTEENSSERKCLENMKLQRILDIWQNQREVVCLQAFHNTSSQEAYTREAAIIEAMSLTHLSNRKHGQYYGIVKDIFTKEQRRLLGVGLLYRAMHIYMAEGESSIGPADVGTIPENLF